MKKVLFVTAGLLVAQGAFAADVLNCWKNTFNVKTPMMTATIISNGVLSDIRFNYKNMGLEAPNGHVRGALITTNRSPYKGNVQYWVKGAGTLILPADLSEKNLKKVYPNGISRLYKQENGVLISTSGDDAEGGNHVSYRLRCESTK